jgi:CRP-like cAMP-binding protein
MSADPAHLAVMDNRARRGVTAIGDDREGELRLGDVDERPQGRRFRRALATPLGLSRVDWGAATERECTPDPGRPMARGRRCPAGGLGRIHHEPSKYTLLLRTRSARYPGGPTRSRFRYASRVTTPEKRLYLREAWEDASRRDRPKDAAAALEALGRLEPQEPRWPHRLGEVLRRLGRVAEAEAAFVRAVRVYVSHGFLTRAAAVAKIVVEMNPARADILKELDQAPAQKLRDEHRPAPTSHLNPRMPPPPRLPSGTMGALLPPGEIGPVPKPPIPREEPHDDAPIMPKSAAVSGGDDDDKEEDERPSLVAGVPVDRLGVVAAAMGLEQAKDAAADEVRFENVPDVFAINIDVSELESQEEMNDAPEIEVRDFEADEPSSAVRLALMSGATLFAAVPPEAMAELVDAAELLEMKHGAFVYRREEAANGLYVLVEGMVLLVRPGAARALALNEGQVFGEDCLLEGAARAVDVRVNGRMLALRIPKEALDRVVARHSAVGDVLFDVLVRRLVTNALQTSTLFAAFDLPTRKELARLFEVRRASPGVVIKRSGKRSDGLYLALAGTFEVERDGKKSLLQLGTMFGHTSLVSEALEKHTIVVRNDAVVLRLSAARFLTFAARFPAALAHLTELAKNPLAV